jgi:hypothetical protein
MLTKITQETIAKTMIIVAVGLVAIAERAFKAWAKRSLKGWFVYRAFWSLVLGAFGALIPAAIAAAIVASMSLKSNPWPASILSFAVACPLAAWLVWRLAPDNGLPPRPSDKAAIEKCKKHPRQDSNLRPAA